MEQADVDLEESRETEAPVCPLCEGILVPLRGTLRCSKCGYVTCEACGTS